MMALQQKHTMALQDTTPDELLSLLTRRPQHIVKGMLQIAEPAKQSSNWRKSTSSLGRLDDLPLELLHATLALLDFKSLSHVSRTCIRGIEVVNSLPEHRDLMLHAPDALAALAKTRSIRHHLAANIHLALLSANCRLCSRYGALLHLPTCERCCYHCLWTNQSLWLIPISMAKKCFLLSEAAAKTLPVLRSVPGKYHVRYPISRQRPIGLVCVGAAKELSIAENVSERDLSAYLELHVATFDRGFFQYLQKASITPPQQELWLQSCGQDAPNDRYCGMGSLSFPSLSPDKHVEYALWCKGCELVSREWSSNYTIPNHLAHLVLPGSNPAKVVKHFREIARSKAEFLAHIEVCPGAKKLLQQAKAL
ncbi:hypothetical protein Q7P36_004431 [Cladosporium allicinum]